MTEGPSHSLMMTASIFKGQEVEQVYNVNHESFQSL